MKPIDWNKFADTYEIGVGTFGNPAETKRVVNAVTVRVAADGNEIFLSFGTELAEQFIREFQQACREAWPEKYEARKVLKQ